MPCIVYGVLDFFFANVWLWPLTICTGAIPKELGQLVALKELFLNNNKLSGELAEPGRREVLHRRCVALTTGRLGRILRSFCRTRKIDMAVAFPMTHQKRCCRSEREGKAPRQRVEEFCSGGMGPAAVKVTAKCACSFGCGPRMRG